MKKKFPTTEELLNREVVRPHISGEWRSRMTTKEFWAWCDAQADIHRFRGNLKKGCIQDYIEEDIKQEEQTFVLLKDIQKSNGLKKTDDIKLGGAITGTTYQTKYGKIKGLNTLDLVGIPSVKDAVLQEFDVPNKNGRIYSSDIEWDNYKKHVKKYGI